ncbi:MAG: APC family permease [Lachnospiraceae bacterium]|nr:APC family permease [Lachnospiraceae bacterium]
MDSSRKKGVSALDFFCIGFGAIIGVGWAVSINSWMTSCGGPVPAAIGYLILLVILIPVGLCYAELVPAIPVVGGVMIFARKAFGPKMAMVAGWASLGGMISILPWEAIQITDVLGYLFPALKNSPVLYTLYGSDIHLSTILIGLACAVLMFLLNIKGLKAAATAQKILCLVLIACAVIGGAAALLAGSPSNLTPVYDVSDPAIYGPGLVTVTHKTFLGACFAIVAQAAFFLSGFETIPQGIEDAGGDVKSVGKTVVLSVVLACLFYAGLLICFGIAWPWKQFAGMERPATASLFLYLYPGAVGRTLYWVLVIGAIAGLFTSWNGFFTAAANLTMSMSREHLLPAFLGKQTADGIAIRGQIACLILSILGPFLGPNLIDAITCFSAITFSISWGMCAWSMVFLRKKAPEIPRPYRMPGGLPAGLFAAIAMTLVVAFMLLPFSPFYVGSLSVMAFAGWSLLGAVLYAISRAAR